MKVYRLTFSRTNYTLLPPAIQSSDVVFQSNKALGDGNPYHCDVAKDAWEAMYEQNPHWREHTFPVSNIGGWSSVNPIGKIEDVPIIKGSLGIPGDGTPRLCEVFCHNGARYRVTSFYKQYHLLKAGNPDCIVEQLVQEQQDDLDAKGQILIVPCYRQDAEFIAGSGVSGIILPIDQVNIIGRVAWDDTTIQRERDNYTVIDNFPTRLTLT